MNPPEPSSDPPRTDSDDADRGVGPRSWGGVARRGATKVEEEPREGEDTASAAWKQAVRDARDEGAGTGIGTPPEDWIERDEDDRDEDDREGGEPPDDVAVGLSEAEREELARQVGTGQVPRFEQRLDNAGRAFRAGRFEDAAKILEPLADRAPGSVAVRELYGLTLYRLSRWKLAIRELTAFEALARSVDQHPVLADCYRALRRHKEVARLWAELREASPSAELVTEGRIVMAGSLADRDELDEALRTLGHPSWKMPRRPKEHHLRRAYALADLTERAGDVPRARSLFERIEAADPGFGDVRARLGALRGRAVGPRPPSHPWPSVGPLPPRPAPDPRSTHEPVHRPRDHPSTARSP